MGVLSWLIEQGDADGVDLGGLLVALACRYSDDEPGSPWTWILYLDAESSAEQRAALHDIFTGRLGGDAERHFPRAWKTSELVAVRPVEIMVDPTRHRQRLRIGDQVRVRIRDRHHADETVTCVIPGHERAGDELVADELVVDDGPLSFSYRGGMRVRIDIRLFGLGTGLRLSSRTKSEPTSSPFADILTRCRNDREATATLTWPLQALGRCLGSPGETTGLRLFGVTRHRPGFSRATTAQLAPEADPPQHCQLALCHGLRKQRRAS
jgi:hypothetical protein